jgi:hypothetical protein
MNLDKILYWAYKIINITIIITCGILLFKNCSSKKPLEDPTPIEGREISPGFHLADTAYIDMEDYILLEEELRVLQEELSRLNYELIGQSTVVASSSGRRTEVIVVTEPGQTVTPVQQELLVDFDDVGVPVGSVSLTELGNLTTASYDLNINVDTSIVQTDERSLTTVTRLTLLSNGNPYVLPIHSTTVVDPSFRIDTSYNTEEPEPLKRFYARPNFTLGIGLGVPFRSPRMVPQASLGIGYMYLRDKAGEDEWSFLDMSLGFNSIGKFNFNLMPFSYNLGNPMPLISDLWISPFVQWSGPGSYGAGLGFHTRL